MSGRNVYLFGLVICLCLTTVLCDYPCICIDISTLNVLPYIGYLQYNEYVHMETCSGHSVVDEIVPTQSTSPTTAQIHIIKTDNPMSLSHSISPVISSPTYITETSTKVSSTGYFMLASRPTPLSHSPSRSPTTQITTSTKTPESTTIKMTTASPTLVKSTSPKRIPELSTSAHYPQVDLSSTTTTRSATGHYAAVTVPPDVLKGDISGCPKLPNSGGANIMIQYQGNCYEIMTTSRYSYQFAETHCTIRGGHLVTIPNLMTEEYLRQILQKWFNKPVWIGYNNVSGHAEWTSGASIHYTNFAGKSGVQAGSGNNQSCAVYNARGSVGVWELHGCTEKFAYICQYLFSGFHSSVAPVTQAYIDPLQRCRNKLGIYDNSVQTDGVHCYRYIQSVRSIHTNPLQHCDNVKRLCGSSNGYLVQPSTNILRALVPNNVFVTVPGHSYEQKRFLDTLNGCATLKLESDGSLHHVFFTQTITTYSVCRYAVFLCTLPFSAYHTTPPGPPHYK